MGNNQCAGRVVGVCGCFLVPACVYCPVVGWWVWVRCGVGHKRFWRACTLSGSRSTPCERLPPVVGWWLPAQPAWIVCGVGVGVCGGLFVICIVVASIFVLYCFLCFV